MGVLLMQCVVQLMRVVIVVVTVLECVCVFLGKIAVDVHTHDGCELQWCTHDGVSCID